jgi:hypothetical protein
VLLDRQGLVHQPVGQPLVVLEDELLDLLGGLELVDEDHLVDVHPHEPRDEEVDHRLADVGGERTRDRLPDTLHVDDLSTVQLVGVLGEDLGVVEADGSLTDALDLEQGLQVRESPVFMTDGAVGILGVQRNLKVSKKRGTSLALGALLGGRA